MSNVLSLSIFISVCSISLGMLDLQRKIADTIPDTLANEILQQDIRDVATKGSAEAFCNIIQGIKACFSFMDSDPAKNAYHIIFQVDACILRAARETDTVYNDAYVSMKSVLYSLRSFASPEQKELLDFSGKMKIFLQFREPVLRCNFYDCDVDMDERLVYQI